MYRYDRLERILSSDKRCGVNNNLDALKNDIINVLESYVNLIENSVSIDIKYLNNGIDIIINARANREKIKYGYND